MKSLKILSSALALVLAVSVTSAFAQQSGSINTNANVLTNLTVTGLLQLDFNDVTAGVTDEVDKGNVGSNEQLGKFKVEGASSASVELELFFPSVLTGPGANIPFNNGDRMYFNTIDAVASATQWGSNPGSTNLNGSGNLWVYVGGEVTPSNGQQPGAYSGTITLQAAYN